MCRKTEEKSSNSLGQPSLVQCLARLLLALTIVMMVLSNLQIKVEAAAGDLDTTFSTDGKQRTVFGLSYESAQAVAIQSDSKIVVAGYTLKNNAWSDFALARYNSDGTLDTTFSGDGKQVTDMSGLHDYAYAVAIQSDGKIVVAGHAGYGGAGASGFGLARYNSDGTLDLTFDGDGKVITDFGDHAAAVGMVIQPNGKIVLGGSTYGDNFDFALARYNSNGTLDTTFSTDGKQRTDFGSDENATAVALQSNGKIVVVGSTTNEFALARYNSNGSLDTTFSGDGKVTTLISTYAVAHAVTIQPDGKIVVAGFAAFEVTDYDFALARYNGNGSLDDGSVNDRTPNDAFGTNGIVITDFFSSRDIVNGVALQANGKIVAAGAAARNDRVNSDYALARYDTDGMLDNTFSTDGKQSTDFAGGTRDEANAIKIQTDGRIVVAGFVGKSPGDFDFGLTRYLGD